MRAFLQVQPILRALLRHKTTVTLLVLEMAMTMAILSNLIFIVSGDIQRSRITTGTVENKIGLIQSIGVVGYDNPSNVAENLMTLRSVPGVEYAAYGSPPFWNVERDSVFLDSSHQRGNAHIYEFTGSQGLSRTLGVHVIQGKDFHESELPVATEINGNTEMPVLVTQALAEHLFPHGNALNQIIYDGGTNPMHIIGVVAQLRGEITNRVDDGYSIIAEYLVGKQDIGGGFMIRVNNSELLPQTLRAASAALARRNPGHVQQDVVTMNDLRKNYFRSDLATGHMLISIVLVVLAVTAMGVSGLASFWVQQRRRQIGMRRALGATRVDILRYFQMENFLIVTCGVLLGSMFSYALNAFFMERFELTRLPFGYLVVGAISLWLLGQFSVLGPAFRAAALPPSVASRL